MQSAFWPSALTFKRWCKFLTSRTAFNIGVAVGGVLVARLLSSITLIILARVMGVASFGEYTTLYALLGPVTIVASLGLDTWLLRSGGDARTVDAAINDVFSVRLIVSVVLMTMAVIAVRLNGGNFSVIVVVSAALGLVCELMLTTASTALRAQLRNRAAAMVQIVAAALLISLIWLFWHGQTPLLTATLYRSIAGVIGVVLAALLLGAQLHITWQPRRLLYTLKQARVYFLSDILAAIALRADLTLIALFYGAIGTAIYSPALTIINTTFIVPQVVWQVLLPMIGRQRHVLERVRWLIVIGLVGGLLYGLLWVGIFLWQPVHLIDLVYGAQYRDAAFILEIMSCIPLLKSFNFCWATVMIAYDRQVLRTKLQAIGAFVGIAGNLMLIPTLGALGAAWVNLLAEVVLFVGYTWGAWRTLHAYRLEAAYAR